jgi:hypothetical protein
MIDDWCKVFFDINRFGESYSLFEDGIMDKSKRERLEAKGGNSHKVYKI